MATGTAPAAIQDSDTMEADTLVASATAVVRTQRELATLPVTLVVMELSGSAG